jgi:cobalt-zinc-cadmium efflux system outer membrane protein
MRIAPLLILLSMLANAQPSSVTQSTVTVDQAVQEALQKNLDLLAAKYELPIAETRMITARLRPNPVVSVSADHLDMLGTGYNAINNGGPAEYAYRTDFILERGSKREARMELAKQDQAIARWDVLNAARTVVFDAQSAFLDVLAAKENLQLAESNLKALQEIVNVNNTRVRSGDLAQVELSRSRVAALQFQAAVQQARIRLTEAKNHLQLLIGRTTLSPDFDVSGQFRREVPTLTFDELSTRAIQQRPDLEAIRASQARSQADLRLQIAQGRIDYTVGSEYRRQQGIAGTGNSLGFFFSAPLPVFNRNQGEIERARRESEQNTARLRALDATIRNQLTSAWQRYESSRALLDQVESTMIDQAQQVRKTTEYSYRRGEATLVEFLDAQRAFNDTMQTYNEARADYARSLYLLDALAGTRPASLELTP